MTNGATEYYLKEARDENIVLRARVAELEIERDDIAASLLECSEMLILHAKSAGDTIKSLSDKTDNIAKAVFSEIHQTLSEAFQEKIYERDARIAHLEREATPEEVEAAAEAICGAWNYEWNGEPGGDQTPDDEPEGDDKPSRRLYRDAAREALAAALKIRIGDGK